MALVPQGRAFIHSQGVFRSSRCLKDVVGLLTEKSVIIELGSPAAKQFVEQKWPRSAYGPSSRHKNAATRLKIDQTKCLIIGIGELSILIILGPSLNIFFAVLSIKGVI